LYPFVYVKACEGKLIQYPFLFDDNSASLKVHCKNPFLLNFISLFIRVFIAHWMSIKNKTRRFVYERSRVLAPNSFINNCNKATKIKGGTYVEKFV